MRATIPPSDNELTRHSATELADMIRTRQASCRQVLDAHIARIRQVNPAINALVTDTFDAAQQQADRADGQLATGKPTGPLHGVPFTAKDSIEVAGVRSTCGLSSRRDQVPTDSATVVARMADAGAILLGKTNTPEACWSQETTNTVFGRTNNPWDLSRTVGGSTGGEAAIIAAEGSPLGIGSDIAGSIRLPAHFTGIVGFRPTSASLPEDGQWPKLGGGSQALESLGPMARTVHDVALGWNVLRGAQPEPLDEAGIGGCHVAHWLGDGMSRAQPEICAGVHTAVEALTAAGMLPVDGAPKARTGSIGAWAASQLAADRDELARSMGNGEPWSPWSEIGHHLRGRPRVSRETLDYWLASHTGSLLGQVLRADGSWHRDRLLEQLHGLLGDSGVAVAPVHPTVAATHGWTRRRLAMFTSINYQTWVNLAGLPGLSIPVGWHDGLPFGVQVVGMPGQERQILAAGAVIERAVAFRTPAAAPVAA